ncbi:MAG TPA: prephenate dehydrogenase/arogenate dehydrogenase family protein [Nitrospiria bacterium]
MPKRLAGKSKPGRGKTRRPFGRIVIIGVGLIGGSIGLAVRKNRLADDVIGLGPNPRELKKAVSRGAIKRGVSAKRDYPHVLEGADLVILSGPVGTLVDTAALIAPWITGKTVVTDVGSVKRAIVEPAAKHLSHEHYIGGHPIAGREFSGVEAAEAGLFSGAVCILTPTKETSTRALRTVERLWKGIGSRTVRMDPETHDWILGLTSHLPHVVAYALISAVLEMQSARKGLTGYSAGGLRDFTRVAASSPEMWRDICMANRDALMAGLDAFEAVLARIRRHLKSGNAKALLSEFKKAGAGKKALASRGRSKRGRA